MICMGETPQHLYDPALYNRSSMAPCLNSVLRFILFGRQTKPHRKLGKVRFPLPDSNSRTLEFFHVIVALPHALDKETHAMHLLLVGVRQREQHLV